MAMLLSGDIPLLELDVPLLVRKFFAHLGSLHICKVCDLRRLYYLDIKRFAEFCGMFHGNRGYCERFSETFNAWAERFGCASRRQMRSFAEIAFSSKIAFHLNAVGFYLFSHFLDVSYCEVSFCGDISVYLLYYPVVTAKRGFIFEDLHLELGSILSELQMGGIYYLYLFEHEKKQFKRIGYC